MEGMLAKDQAERLLLRHGLKAVDILLQGISVAVQTCDDDLALELDCVLQELEHLFEDGNCLHVFFGPPTIH